MFHRGSEPRIVIRDPEVMVNGTTFAIAQRQLRTDS
jgi:hypothetical protein